MSNGLYKSKPWGSLMVLDLGVMLILAVAAWKLVQLVAVLKLVHLELVTARWQTHERVRALERQVESERECALSGRG